MFGCGNTDKNGVALHSFPRKMKIRRQWVAFVRSKRGDWDGRQPVAWDVTCSAHFTPECYPGQVGVRKSLGFIPFSNYNDSGFTFVTVKMSQNFCQMFTS